MVETELVEDPFGLERLESDWDSLAVTCARPCSAPGFLMPWWRNLAPRDASPRVVTVRDDGRLIGLAPFLVTRGPMGMSLLRLFGTPTMPQRSGLLAAPGREGEVVAATARALQGSDPSPRILKLERIDADARWPALLADAWPTRSGAWLHGDFHVEAPVLRMAGGLDEWLAGKSSNFRGQMRRIRRRLEARGASIAAAGDVEAARRGIDAFARLHRARWQERSRLWQPGTTATLKEAAERLLASGRMRVWTVEAGGSVVSAQLFFAAGGEVVYWNGGWDPAWSHERPALAAIYAAVEECFARGDARLDFGEGAHDYKLRFANADDPVAWATVVPRGAAYPVARAATAPRRMRGAARQAARAMPEPARRVLWRVMRRDSVT